MNTKIDSGTGTVEAEITDGVGLIVLNRPERRNALHPDMYDAIPRLIDRFDAATEVGCILLTGAGSAFCAGGDVRGGAERRRPPESGSQDGDQDPRHFARMVLMLRDSPKISIAALPGPAVGAGVGLALAADLRIAAHSARLIGGWGRLAFSGDFGGTWFLTRMLGHARALEFLLGDTPIDAEAATRLGLFNRVVPAADLPAAALAWAKEIAAGPREAFGLMKENVRDAQRLDLDRALPLESARMARSAQTDEHRRAVKRWLAEMNTRSAKGSQASGPDTG
ncbi:enoyl-CoA hydratase/isomerase family protein [Nonomuraea sp. NPDC002799]